MERRERLERSDEKRVRGEKIESGDGLGIWRAVGIVALLGVAALVIVNLPDVERYIKMSRMK